MNRIYSKENQKLLLNNIGDNGDIISTTNSNRFIHGNDIYLNMTTNKKLIPTLYKNYYVDGVLNNWSKQYSIIEAGTNELVFQNEFYDDHDFVSYYITFECLENDTIISIDELGVLFEIDITLEDEIAYNNKLDKDINGNVFENQTITKYHSFSIITNRAYLERVINILKKPFKLINILDGCIDNSSNLLAEISTNIEYLGNNKLIKINIKSIEGK